MTEYTSGSKYVLHYTWTPTEGANKGVPQKAEVSATFTGNNKKVRHLSKEMLATMSPVLDREIEAGGTW